MFVLELTKGIVFLLKVQYTYSMSKPVKQYNAVTMKNGVTRQVPTQYHKPSGKKKTVSMTLPIALTSVVENLANIDFNDNKSNAYETLLLEALESRGLNVQQINE